MKIRLPQVILAVLALVMAPGLAQTPLVKTYGINFSPYLTGQNPNLGTQVTAAQILSRMQVVAPYTVWVRSFSSTNGNENTPSVARQLGLKIAANAWISSNQAQNAVEISNLIAAANAGLVDVAIVGSEAILRNDVTVPQLIAYMQQVRQAIPSSIPVTTADVWGTLIANPSLIAASDVVFANFYPYWEGTSVSNALCSLQQEYQQLVRASGSKTVVVSETGWPSAGDAVGAAVPSVENANLFALQFLTWAHNMNIQSFYFEAFNEDWKVASEGPQGANWGIWDENANLKPGMGEFFNGQTSNAVCNGTIPGPVGIAPVYVPPYGSSDAMEVQVTGVQPASYAIAAYIKVGGGWWTKPTFAQPTVSINPDGTARIAIVTGGSDQDAVEIEAFLIPAGSQPPLVGNGGKPTLSNAVASFDVTRTQSSISGTITDSQGNPISGAVISDPVLGSTSSAPDGKYSFYQISTTGTVTLSVNFPNYSFPTSPTTLAISSGNQIVNFSGTATVDLSVEASVSQTSVLPGAQITATIVASNAGPAAATDAILALSIPASFTNVTVSTTRGSCSASVQPVTCDLGGLAATAYGTVTVEATTGSAGSYSLVATISGPDKDSNLSNNSTSLNITVTAPTLQSIAVTPASPSILKGATEQFTATGTYSDGSTQNLTSSVTWTSGTPANAAITAAGLATGVAAGTSTISAKLGGVTGSTVLTVTAPIPLLNGLIGFWTGNYTAADSSPVGNNGSFAGSYLSKGPGGGGAFDLSTAKVTIPDNAAYNFQSYSGWTVGFWFNTNGIAPNSNNDLFIGQDNGSGYQPKWFIDYGYTVYGPNSDFVWHVNDYNTERIFLASQPVNPIPAGWNQLTVVVDNTGQKVTFYLNGLSIGTSSLSSYRLETSAPLIFGYAEGFYFNGWMSNVAIYSRALSAQEVAQLANSPVLTVALQSIAVTPANPSIVKGVTEQFTATGTYSDGSTQNLTSSVTWTSGTPANAIINAAGLATGVAAGTSTISAKLGSISGSTVLTVTAPTLRSIAVTPANPSILKGATQQFTATGTYSDGSTQNLTSSVTWASGTAATATITAGGLATGAGVGTSTISAKLGSISGSTVLTVTAPTLRSIAVTPANPSILKGATEQFTATGTYSDGSTQNLTSSVTWASGTAATATITAGGLATGAGVGTSTISAKLSGVTGTTVLTVTAPPLTSIAVTPANPSVPKGATQQFTATGTYSDGSTQNLTSSVTWASGTAATATITAGGLATGAGVGTSTISAKLSGVTGTTVLTVTAPTLRSIAVTPANPSILKGATQQFTATGTYSDGSTQNLTSSVTWASGTAATATITAGGLATGAGVGTSTISAKLGSISGSTVLTVTAPPLTSIAVTPANPSVPKGATQQFTATGTYSDGSTQNLTSSVTWASGTAATATITAGGLATGVGIGTSTIGAKLGGVTSTTVLTVTAPALTSIAVTPANLSIVKGATQQFTATGTYSDGSTQVLTSSVIWASGTAATATITAGGLATGAGVGTSTISAKLSGVTGTTVLTVTAPPAVYAISAGVDFSVRHQLFEIDPANGALIQELYVTVPGESGTYYNIGGLAFGQGSLWAISAGVDFSQRHQLFEINPANGALIQELYVTVPAESGTYYNIGGLAFGQGSLWAISAGVDFSQRHQLFEINPASGALLQELHVTVPAESGTYYNIGGLAFGQGSLWAISAGVDFSVRHQLFQINPTNGALIQESYVTVPGESGTYYNIGGLAFGQGNLWAISAGVDFSQRHQLFEINPSNGALLQELFVSVPAESGTYYNIGGLAWPANN